MASLKQTVRNYREEVIDGIAWVVFFKRGRSWDAQAFWSDDGDYDSGFIFDSDDMEAMNAIAKLDHKAICINGYYMGFGEDFTVEEITNKVLWYYEERRCQLAADFLECYVVH